MILLSTTTIKRLISLTITTLIDCHVKIKGEPIVRIPILTM